MSALRKLAALALGHSNDTVGQLQAAEVPVSESLCRSCADPCDEGHDEFPKFAVDTLTDMLGSVKPYGRQVVISSGKTDWVREVTDAKDTLAAHISKVSSSDHSDSGHKDKTKKTDSKSSNGASVSGVFEADPSKHKRVTILNGSHRSVAEDSDKETVLIFPDYTVATAVPSTHAGAEELWKQTLSPSIGIHDVPRVASTGMKTWILPYACVILLCSHKRRDNRCALAAPKLEHALTLALEREGWEVHTQLDDPSHGAPALEDDPTLAAHAEDDDARAALIRERLRAVDAAHAEHKRALILFCSHIGGHKYAGNVIINTPGGASVWYGRVTPHEVDAIVRETIIGGKVLPALLRGGMNLCQPGRKSLNDW